MVSVALNPRSDFETARRVKKVEKFPLLSSDDRFARENLLKSIETEVGTFQAAVDSLFQAELILGHKVSHLVRQQTQRFRPSEEGETESRGRSRLSGPSDRPAAAASPSGILPKE
jgi:hypothetical protein